MLCLPALQRPVNIFEDEYAAYDEVDGEEMNDEFDESPWSVSHMSHIACRMSHVACCMSHVTCCMSHVACRKSHVTFHMSHVACAFKHLCCVLLLSHMHVRPTHHGM